MKLLESLHSAAALSCYASGRLIFTHQGADVVCEKPVLKQW